MRGPRTIPPICGHDAFGLPWFGCYNAPDRGRGFRMIEGAIWHGASRRRGWRSAACALAAATALAGCASDRRPVRRLEPGARGLLRGRRAPAASGAPASASTTPPASSSPSFTSRVKSFFSGSSSNPLHADDERLCRIRSAPTVESSARAASTYAVNTPGVEASAAYAALPGKLHPDGARVHRARHKRNHQGRRRGPYRGRSGRQQRANRHSAALRAGARGP